MRDLSPRVGMGLPDIYSADISFFALRAAAEILARETPPLMYLSLTDYFRDCRKSLFLKFFSFRALPMD